MYLSTQVDECKHDSGYSDMESSETQSMSNKGAKEQELTHVNPEYAKLWEEMKYTGQGLDELFEESKNSAFEIKQEYDSIHQLITINEALKLKYYDALSTKKKFDEERDEYFKIDAELARRRDDFIENSQKHALQHSRYVEYSKRFSARREEYIERLLKDVEIYFDRIEKQSRENLTLRKEISEHRQELISLRHDLRAKTSLHEKAMQNCERLTKDLEKHKKELQWVSRQAEKLKATNARLEEEKENLKTREEEMAGELQNYIKSIDELAEKRRLLQDRCSQLNQRLQARDEEYEEEVRARRKDQVHFDNERSSLSDQITKIEQQKQTLKESNHKVARQLESLRKNFDEAKKKTKDVTRAKNLVVSKEHSTRNKNEELAEKQVELIDEVLCLKRAFYQDQDRIAKGGMQYRRLEGKADALKRQIEIMKEDPTVLDPLEFAQEYREVIAKKFTQPPYSPHKAIHGSTYFDTAIKKHAPIIGQMPEPKTTRLPKTRPEARNISMSPKKQTLQKTSKEALKLR